MTPKQLQDWIAKTHAGNVNQAAASIGVSRWTLYRYRDGVSEIPLTVELACKAIELLK